MAEQYLRDQLNKATVDAMDDILKQFGNKLKKMWQLIK